MDLIMTLILSVITMAGLFLMLWSGVAFIQDKRFFSSAHKDILAIITPKQERFKGQHILGYVLAFVAVAMNIGAIITGAVTGIHNGFGFWQFFLRFGLMVILLKLYDIIFFDWVLLCNSNFFPRYYPETRAVIGRHMFGYNKVSHLIHTIVYLAGAALLSLICIHFV